LGRVQGELTDLVVRYGDREGEVQRLTGELGRVQEELNEFMSRYEEQAGQVQLLKKDLATQMAERVGDFEMLSQKIKEKDGTIAERDERIEEISNSMAAWRVNALESSHQNKLLQNAFDRLRQDTMQLSVWATRMNEKPLTYAFKKHVYQLSRRVLARLPFSLESKQKARALVLKLTHPFRSTSASSSGGSPLVRGEAHLPLLSTPLSDQRDVFVFSVIDWHFRIQRPQQLARGFAQKGRRVFFFSNHFVDSGTPGYVVESLDPVLSLYQIKLHVRGAPQIYFSPPSPETIENVRQSLAMVLIDFGSQGSVSLIQHPFWYPIVWKLPNTYRVYDCMDHHEGFGNVPEKLIQMESDMLRSSDLVVVTSSWLEKFARGFNPNVVVVRNGCDFDHFNRQPSEIYSDPQKRKIIGYYGAIAEWFDLDLVRAVARAFPDCLVLLIGNDTVKASESLKDLPNVVFVGEVPYTQLPFYAHAFDVCLLPFKVIPLTLATNPVKIYEYLSVGKPVVSVDLPEMAQFGFRVVKSKDSSDFVRSISRLLNKNRILPKEAEQRISFAKSQTWAHRVDELCSSLGRIPMPKISVVVLTYNNLALTKDCLDSLLKRTDYPNLEIIVVDNASSDQTPHYLKELERSHPQIRVILNGENVGFSAGNNIGLAAATGDYLVLLNNDTVVTTGWAMTLMRHLQSDPSIGLLGPVTNNIGNEARIETTYKNPSDMPQEAHSFTVTRMGRVFSIKTVAFFCAIMPRATYEKVGPLCEEFQRGFFEDDDYCRRVESFALKVMCADDVFIHHHLSASFNKLSEQQKKELFDRNKEIYEKKWGKWVPHSYR